jgi:hypothetical protein
MGQRWHPQLTRREGVPRQHQPQRSAPVAARERQRGPRPSRLEQRRRLRRCLQGRSQQQQRGAGLPEGSGTSGRASVGAGGYCSGQGASGDQGGFQGGTHGGAYRGAHDRSGRGCRRAIHGASVVQLPRSSSEVRGT